MLKHGYLIGVSLGTVFFYYIKVRPYLQYLKSISDQTCHIGCKIVTAIYYAVTRNKPFDYKLSALTIRPLDTLSFDLQKSITRCWRKLQTLNIQIWMLFFIRLHRPIQLAWTHTKNIYRNHYFSRTEAGEGNTSQTKFYYPPLPLLICSPLLSSTPRHHWARKV